MFIDSDITYVSIINQLDGNVYCGLDSLLRNVAKLEQFVLVISRYFIISPFLLFIFTIIFSKRVKIVVLKMAVLKSLHEVLRCRTPKWLEFFPPHGNEKDLKDCVLLQHKKVCGV